MIRGIHVRINALLVLSKMNFYFLLILKIDAHIDEKQVIKLERPKGKYFIKDRLTFFD